MDRSSFTPQLRPLSIGEMLDGGFRLLRARFGTLMLCVLVPVVPLMILGTVVQASVDENAYDLDAPATVDEGSAVAALLISTALESAAAALAVVACFKAISAAYLGERAGAGDSLRFALSRILPIVVAYVVISLISFIGLILLILPGVFLFVRLSMTFPAVVFERAGPFRGIGRSWELVRGNWWRTFATLVVVFLLVLVVSVALGGVVGLLFAGLDSLSEAAVAILDTLLNVLIAAVVYPLWAAVLTVIYYDLRVRNEGFDLQLLAQGVGADASRFAASPERPAPPAQPQAPGGGFAPPEGSTSPS